MAKCETGKALFAVFALWSMQLAFSGNKSNIVCQGTICNCSQDLITHSTLAQCSIRDWRELQTAILCPQKVVSL